MTTDTKIYDQHKAAFANVSAFVILNGARERVATVAFKYPRDGAGRLYCYLHIIGSRMARGYASGGGYDKHSAAISVAAKQVSAKGLPDGAYGERIAETLGKFQGALRDSGYSWQRELENAGFTVLQAV